MEETARQVIDDLTSRGALAGAASLGLLAAILVGWWAWTTRIVGERKGIPVAILITGSRGKSSTVRLLHSALAEGGFSPYGKITGTAASEISTDGSETETFRLGAPSVLETFSAMRRAFRATPKADSLIFECMAVSPELIELLSDRMVEPGVVVITNARLDHLEEEGMTLAEIAASMAEAIRPESVVVTGASSPEVLDSIERRAKEENAELVVSGQEELPPGTLERLPFAHPQNVGLTLSVTRSLGIDDEIAVAGMAGASREPGDHEVWMRRVDGLDAFWTDLGAINDPESLGQALDQLDLPVEPAAPRIAMLFGRWDRPLRALEFAGYLRPGQFDGMIIAGGPVLPVRKVLIEAGWAEDRLVLSPAAASIGFPWRGKVNDLARQVAPDATAVGLVSLENEHDGVADQVRSHFRKGDRVDGSGARSPGEDDGA